MFRLLKAIGLVGVLVLVFAVQRAWAQDDSHIIYDEDVATLEPPPILGARSAAYSFRKSKYQMATEVYHDHRQTFYGDCRFRQYQKRLMPVHSSCGYRTRKNENRARRIEWEHVMPAWVFGHQLRCWQQGGRSECANKHQRFKQMEADMHNLVPAVGELNGDRSNFGFRMISGEPRAYGSKINMEIDFSQRAAEPPEAVWGDIARIYFYMRERYQLRLSANEEQLFRAWNNLDPVDDWERLRNERITRLQGNHNPFVTHYRTMSGSAADIKVETEAGAGTNTNNAVSDDVVDELYRLMMDNREALPPVLVAILAAIYWFYRKKNPKRKATKKTTTAQTKKTKKTSSPKKTSKPKPRPKPKPTRKRSRRKPAAEEKESAPKRKTTRRRTSRRKTRSSRSKSKED